MVASLLKERRASTSVETRPGTIFKISAPKLTKSLSVANSSFSSSELVQIISLLFAFFFLSPLPQHFFLKKIFIHLFITYISLD